MQARLRIMKTRRKLEEEAAHARPEKIGNMSEVVDQCFCPAEALDVSDEFRGFDGVNKLPSSRLPDPTAHGCRRGPGVKGRVEFHGLKVIGVVSEPIGRGQASRVEPAAPMPVEPSGTANVESWQGEIRHRKVIFTFPREAGDMHRSGASRVFATLLCPPPFTPGSTFLPR